ncbi:hypothetical protein HPB50_004844 [Hyalomma asiaticum]|uniref:Uncharacterized protein n=1 Tax=Hyalomma asiaticum TaxID=266040 RepID=A0ACB7SE36_HYAAI|nr:hypothetical protein HPB50_004844 [Hyalomma asiaticum]
MEDKFGHRSFGRSWLCLVARGVPPAALLQAATAAILILGIAVVAAADSASDRTSGATLLTWTRPRRDSTRVNYDDPRGHSSTSALFVQYAKMSVYVAVIFISLFLYAVCLFFARVFVLCGCMSPVTMLVLMVAGARVVLLVVMFCSSRLSGLRKRTVRPWLTTI